MMLSPN
jgi:hypothetical protein